MNQLGIRKFKDKPVRKGERYIFSASFDVKHDLKSTQRIDEEVPDLKRISDNGGITAVLSHQGRFENGTSTHLDYVAKYLSGKLGREVPYFPENSTKLARDFAAALKPGDVALMGNVRLNAGESKNDPLLAEQFAQLGEVVVIGGFVKAHRSQSSNNGILAHRPGYLASSIIEQLELLEPWQGRKIRQHSVAIVGGVKKEKIEALAGFAEIYDYVIPGGIVLNTVLKALGYEVGVSLLEDSGKTFEREVKETLDNHVEKIYVPQRIRIAREQEGVYVDSKWICPSEGVPNGYSIVDFRLNGKAEEHLGRATEKNGRILLAGTPGIYTRGFKTATDQALRYLERSNVKAIILGGDSVNEIPFYGTTSTGGGSALEYLCKGNLPILDALRQNGERFLEV